MSKSLLRDLIDYLRDGRTGAAGGKTELGRVSFAEPKSEGPARGERDPEEEFLFWAFRPYF